MDLDTSKRYIVSVPDEPSDSSNAVEVRITKSSERYTFPGSAGFYDVYFPDQNPDDYFGVAHYTELVCLDDLDVL